MAHEPSKEDIGGLHNAPSSLKQVLLSYEIH